MDITSTLNSFEQNLDSALSLENIYPVDAVREPDNYQIMITLSASFNDILDAVDDGKLPIIVDLSGIIGSNAGIYMATIIEHPINNEYIVRFGNNYGTTSYKDFSAASPTSYLTYQEYLYN